jgi:ATP-dependent DNA helicase PIF1
LTEIFRQDSDPVFKEILSQIREGTITKSNLDVIQSRVGAKLELPDQVVTTKLYPLLPDVQAENQKQLNMLPGTTYTYKMQSGKANLSTSDNFLAEENIKKLKKSCPAEEEIQLKIGANVILLINLCVKEDLVNGSRGVVVDFEQDANGVMLPFVKFLNGLTIQILPYTWKNFMPNKNKKREKGQMSGVWIRQLPLTLGFAISIHRSQGMTLKYLEVNLDDGCFAPGQAYTALSRATSLKDLTIKKFTPKAFKFHKSVQEFYSKYSGSHQGNQLTFLDDESSNGFRQLNVKDDDNNNNNQKKKDDDDDEPDFEIPEIEIDEDDGSKSEKKPETSDESVQPVEPTAEDPDESSTSQNSDTEFVDAD